MVGRYIFGDFCTGRLFGFRYSPKGPGAKRSFRFRVPYLSSFAEDRAGNIYLIQQFGVRKNRLTRGAVYRLDADRKEVG